MKKRYWFWLTMSAGDSNIISPIIKALSAKYVDGEVFIPHLTIHESIFAEYQSAKEVIDQVSNVTPSFNIDTKGLGFGDEWSKTLFIEIEVNNILISMHSKFHEVFNSTSAGNFMPHISLMYKEGIPVSEKDELIKTLHIPKKFTIEGVALVDPHGNGKSRKDYTRWEIVYERKLS